MSINLQKGQKINLSKESRSGLNKVMVGLGWDEVPQKRGFLLRSLKTLTVMHLLFCSAMMGNS